MYRLRRPNTPKLARSWTFCLFCLLAAVTLPDVSGSRTEGGYATGDLHSDPCRRRSSTSSQELTHGPRVQIGNDKDPADDGRVLDQPEQAVRREGPDPRGRPQV